MPTVGAYRSRWLARSATLQDGDALAEDLAAMRAAGGDDALVAGDATVVIGRDRRAAGGAGGVGAGGLDDDETGAAPGAGTVIGGHAGRGHAVFEHHRHVAGGEDAVFQDDGADAEGGEERREGGVSRHLRFRPLCRAGKAVAAEVVATVNVAAATATTESTQHGGEGLAGDCVNNHTNA